jgi:cytochrome c oxidase subunit IV
MKSEITIEYLDDAVLLDEKVSHRDVFENQRRRWLESQLSHLKLFFSKEEHVRRKTKDYWNKLFINLIPPRIFFAGIFLLIFVISTIQYFTDSNITGIKIRWWVFLFAGYLIALIVAVPSRFMKLSTLSAFVHLPSLLLSYLRALFTMRSGRKQFVHTPKSFTGKSGSTDK